MWSKHWSRLIVIIIPILLLTGLFYIFHLAVQPVTAAPETPDFSQEFIFGSGTDESRQMAAGDINRDGKPDVVVVNSSGTSKQNVVYLHTGQGGDYLPTGPIDCLNSAMRCFGTGSDTTYDVNVGDLNGDGWLDIVTANYGEQNAVYFNVSSNFPASNTFGTGSDNTWATAVGDINGDGLLDVVAGNDGQQSAVYFNQGGGSYASSNNCADLGVSCFGTGTTTVRSLALGDINGDGYLDIVVGTTADDYIFLNDQSGYFHHGPLPPCTVPMPSNVQCINQNNAAPTSTTAVAIGDLDDNGLYDIVTTGSGAATTAFLSNPGSILTRTVSAARDYTDLALGDLDNDGDLDIVVTISDAPNRVFYNDGLGMTFVGDNVGESLNSNSVVIADIDADGARDIIFGHNLNVNVIHLNGGVIGLDDPFPFGGTTENTADIAMGDLNNDGTPDIVVANNNDPVGQQNMIYMNNGVGIFPNTTPYQRTFGDGTDRTTAVALGDMNNDGYLDIVAGNSAQQNYVYLNNQNGQFPNTAAFRKAVGPIDDNTNDLVLGDINGDGYLDIIVGNATSGGGSSQNLIILNDGSGGPGEVIDFSPSDMNTLSVAAGDVDRDGDLDIMVGNSAAGGNNTVYLNNGYGDFLEENTAVFDPGIYNTYGLATADFNRDGYLDIAASNREGQSIVHLNDGSGNFPFTEAYRRILGPVSGDIRGIAVGDIEGDGDQDVIITYVNIPNEIYLNVYGTGSFELGGTFGTSYNGQAVALGDVDGDGDLDAAVGNGETGGFQNVVYYNRLIGRAPLVNNPPFVTVDAPGLVGPMGAMAIPTILTDTTIPMTATLYDPEGDPVAFLGTYFSADGGGSWLPAVTDGTVPTRNLASRAFLVETRAPAAPIPNLGNVMSTIEITQGLHIVDVNVWVNISHNRDTDLDVFLTAPDGTTVELFTDVGGGGANFTNTFLDDEALQNINAGSAPFSGRFRPEGNLSDLIGGPAYGTWTLDVQDDAAGPAGILDSWGFVVTAVGPVNYSSPMPVNLADNSTTTSIVNIPFAHQITDVDVWMILDHPADDNLDVELISPLGTAVTLFTDLPGSNFHSTILDDETGTPIGAGSAPYTGRFQPEELLSAFDGQSAQGDWTLSVTDDTVGNTGTLRAWGLNIYMGDGSYVFQWDTFASGLFGQSDNIVLRMEAFPGYQPNDHDVPGPFQRPFLASDSNPIRVRGTQVRVLSGTTPISQAVVYLLPEGEDDGAAVLGNANGAFQTDENGLLQGRGEINPDDRLIALWPVSNTNFLTFTNSISLYYTSGPPSVGSVEFFTVTNPGEQVLTISPDNKLLLLNLDVSLEWDASADEAFLEQLEADFQRSSEILFDLTNGQAALGKITIYQEKENWETSHVIIYARNTIRPNANLGGIVTTAVTDTISSTQVISAAYLPGQVRMGPTWNRFGNTDGSIGEDWPRAIAHEIGHYAFFLLDNYLGISPDTGLLTHTDCLETTMTDAYAYSEFLQAADWVGDCLNTLAEVHTGRYDWETIQQFYSFLDTTTANDGPYILPLDVTNVSVIDFTPTVSGDIELLEAPYFNLVDSTGAPLFLEREAEGFLIKYHNDDDPTNDFVIALGSPNRSIIHARGAATGDRVCVYDYSQVNIRIGCTDITADSSATITLEEVPNWEPEIDVGVVNSRTLNITVTNVAESSMVVQVLPVTGPALTYTNMISSSGGTVFTQTVTLDEPIFGGFVRIIGPNATLYQEYISEVSFSGGWGSNRIGWGSNRIGWGSNRIGWGSNRIGWGAPVSSNDGQVTIFILEDIFSELGTYALQTLSESPDLPGWLTLVGQAYRFDQVGNLPRSSMTFQYLERDVPPGYEYALAIYYSNDDGSTWQRLETEVDQDDNWASAEVQGEGIYALVATIVMPTMETGWNTFGYPVPYTNTVDAALASIADSYTSVYYNDPANGWALYDQAVSGDHPAYAPLVNDLIALEFGRSYWIYVTQTVTPYLGVPGENESQNFGPLELPPATFYGPLGGGFNAGDTVEAWIDGSLCGTTTAQTITSTVVYRLEVATNGPSVNGCGGDGRTILFKVNNSWMDHNFIWDSSQAWYHPLTQTLSSMQTDLSLTIIDLPDAATAGESLGYVLSITNNGPFTATSIVVSDTLPAEVNFSMAGYNSGYCTEAGGLVTCTLNDLPPGSSTTVMIGTMINPAVSGQITNTASVTAAETDPIPANNINIPEVTTIGGGPTTLRILGMWLGRPGGDLLLMIPISLMLGLTAIFTWRKKKD